MHVTIVKLNGWPDTFDERVIEIASNVDKVTLIRPRPQRGDTDVDHVSNITVRDVYPSRGKSVNRLWLHPLLFPLHLVQAIVTMLLISFSGQNSPDVIHCLDYILGGAVGSTVSLLTGTPLVVSVRGLTEPRYKNMVEQNDSLIGRLNYRILHMVPTFVFSQVDYVITKAEYQKAYLRETYDVAIPCSAIPTGVDYSIFNPTVIEKSTYPEKLADIGPESEATIALFLGRLTEEKGAAVLLESLIEADDPPTDLHMLYVGDFREVAFKEKMRSLVRDDPVPVTIHDERIPYKRVPELMANVGCVALLSEPKHEGVPRVLQEACVLETKVVASNVEGIAEAFQDIGGCHLVDRADPVAIAEAFRKVSTSTLRPDREKLRDKFDMSRNYAKYAEIYAEVAAS